MTVRELREALARYPDDAEVHILVGVDDTVFVDGVGDSVETMQHYAAGRFSCPERRTDVLRTITKTLIGELDLYEEGVVYLHTCHY